MENVRKDMDESISYLIVKIGEEKYGLHVRNVINIHEVLKITHVPMAPVYMKGIMNLREKALPVIDTRVKFHMQETKFTGETCIIVMRVLLQEEEVFLGAVVDSVVEVREIDPSFIGTPPSIGKSYVSRFITGVATIGSEFILLLAYEKLFTLDELEEVSELNKNVIENVSLA